MARKFKAEYEARDIVALYNDKKNEGDEYRMRRIALLMRSLVRMDHVVNIPEDYRAIAQQVKTPYIRDTWSRISASLVAKPPIIHVAPKNAKLEQHRSAAADAGRFDMALVDRLNKESGEDAIYKNASCLVRDGESVLKVVHRPDAWAKFPISREDDIDTRLSNQEAYRKNAQLPVAWRNVDRLCTLFEDGEYGDGWVLEYGEYPDPYLRRRYGLATGTDGSLVVPSDIIEMRANPEDWPLSTTRGYSVKIEFFDQYEWHVVINGIEPAGWPKPNPYAPYIPYFRAKAYDSESLLYSLLFLVPRLDELLTMKLNWSYLGSYPNPIIRSLPQNQAMLTEPTGDPLTPDINVEWKSGRAITLPPGKDISFLVPPPIGSDVNDLINIFRNMIDVAGIPNALRGETASGDSGYLYNQALTAASMHYRLATASLQRQHEQALDFIHWLINHKVRQTVYVQGYQAMETAIKQPENRKEDTIWLSISPDHSGENTANLKLLGPVTVAFRPTLPTDEQARIMMAVQATNAPKPLFPRRYALEKYVEVEDADAIMEELFLEEAMSTGPIHDAMLKKAAKAAGLDEATADPLAGLAAQAGVGPEGGLIPPGPGEINATVPGDVNGQAGAGLPTMPGVNMPVVPQAPLAPGVGGRPPGVYPGQPGGPV